MTKLKGGLLNSFQIIETAQADSDFCDFESDPQKSPFPSDATFTTSHLRHEREFYRFLGRLLVRPHRHPVSWTPPLSPLFHLFSSSRPPRGSSLLRCSKVFARAQCASRSSEASSESRNGFEGKQKGQRRHIGSFHPRLLLVTSGSFQFRLSMN